MEKKTVATIALSGALFASSVVGYRILSTDAWLWASAPSHAYGLVAFTGLDLFLIAALWKGVRYSHPLAIALAITQFVAMTGDLAGLSVPAGTSASAFRTYLTSNTAFVALLAIQPAIAVLGLVSKKQAGPQKGPRSGIVP